MFYENVEPDNPQKGVLVAHKDGQSFNVSGQVRSCGGATLSLLPIASEEDTAINIVYGSEGNTQSEIIRGESSVAKVQTLPATGTLLYAIHDSTSTHYY